MATAFNPDIFIKTTKYHVYFCTWFHSNLFLKPLAKRKMVHLPAYQENGLQAKSRECILGTSRQQNSGSMDP
jgi:hypothetical protein